MATTKKNLNPLNYLKEAKAELEKVTWPTKKDTIRYAIIVVFVSVALALFFTVLDWALSLGLSELIKINS